MKKVPVDDKSLDPSKNTVRVDIFEEHGSGSSESHTSLHTHRGCPQVEVDLVSFPGSDQ